MEREETIITGGEVAIRTAKTKVRWPGVREKKMKKKESTGNVPPIISGPLGGTTLRPPTAPSPVLPSGEGRHSSLRECSYMLS